MFNLQVRSEKGTKVLIVYKDFDFKLLKDIAERKICIQLSMIKV